MRRSDKTKDTANQLEHGLRLGDWRFRNQHDILRVNVKTLGAEQAIRSCQINRKDDILLVGTFAIQAHLIFTVFPQDQYTFWISANVVDAANQRNRFKRADPVL